MANTRIRQITIDGYLATEPKAFENTDKYGIQIVYFTIPTQTYGENNTMWFDVYTPYNLVGPILPYLKKGRYVLVSGDFFEREYTGADGLIRTRKTIRNATVRFGNSGNYESNNI